MDKVQKQNFLRLAKSMFEKYGQEGVVIEYLNTYKYFKSLEEAKQWGRDNKIFKYDAKQVKDKLILKPEFAFELVALYEEYPRSIVSMKV